MTKNNFNDLVETFAVLRGPNGCPWDRKQTHESLIKCLQNESQELIDAINNKDDENMKEELGDVLLQVLMHSQIAAEEGKFTIDDVIQGLYDKLHRRHPHVFGEHAKAATAEEALGCRLRELFSCATFRCYSSTDVLGVELGGALKNVMAIAAGVCDGLGLGHNSRAALLTRGLAEMSRIGEACGAQAATFMGLSGLGDLALTCTGDLSRNRQVGLRLGQGESLEHITSSLGMVAEGVKTTSAVYDLARRLGVETPVTDTVQRLLHGGESPREAVMRLMTRTLRQE